MKDQLQIQPRLSETDSNGHINNTSVMPWLEEGRLHLCRQQAKIQQATVLAHLSADYRSEIEYGQPVQVTTWVQKLGNSSIHYRQQVHQGGSLCIDARAVSVTFNTEQRSKEPLGDSSRSALQRYLDKRE